MSPGTWLHEPPAWRWVGDDLEVTTGPETDFWQRSHNGAIRDSGHFLGTEVTGDFTASVCMRGAYRDRYDQAGLMVRLSEAVWVKAGIEYVDAEQHRSVVVTRGYSDWSVAPLTPAPAAFWTRIERSGGSLRIEGSVDGRVWELMRIGWLTEERTVGVGPMCASPEGSGFEVTFSDLHIDGVSTGSRGSPT